MKPFTLCADDYAQSPAINRAILALVEMGCLDAASCLALSPTWRTDARSLLAAGKVSAGLHFNLTHPFGQPARKVSTLLAAAVLGKIDARMVRAAFEMQWNKFVDAMGCLPRFVDGHQHVHTFPIIRDIVIGYVSEVHPLCHIRTLQPSPGLPPGPFKQRLLEYLSKPMASRLEDAGLPTNRCFAGFRSYNSKGDFRRSFVRWINAGGDPPLIMCHPGMPSDDASDPIRRSRPEEFRYLASQDFMLDCENAISSSR